MKTNFKHTGEWFLDLNFLTDTYMYVFSARNLANFPYHYHGITCLLSLKYVVFANPILKRKLKKSMERKY